MFNYYLEIILLVLKSVNSSKNGVILVNENNDTFSLPKSLDSVPIISTPINARYDVTKKQILTGSAGKKNPIDKHVSNRKTTPIVHLRSKEPCKNAFIDKRDTNLKGKDTLDKHSGLSKLLHKNKQIPDVKKPLNKELGVKNSVVDAAKNNGGETVSKRISTLNDVNSVFKKVATLGLVTTNTKDKDIKEIGMNEKNKVELASVSNHFSGNVKFVSQQKNNHNDNKNLLKTIKNTQLENKKSENDPFQDVFLFYTSDHFIEKFIIPKGNINEVNKKILTLLYKFIIALKPLNSLVTSSDAIKYMTDKKTIIQDSKFTESYKNTISRMIKKENHFSGSEKITVIDVLSTISYILNVIQDIFKEYLQINILNSDAMHIFEDTFSADLMEFVKDNEKNIGKNTKFVFTITNNTIKFSDSSDSFTKMKPYSKYLFLNLDNNILDSLVCFVNFRWFKDNNDIKVKYKINSIFVVNNAVKSKYMVDYHNEKYNKILHSTILYFVRNGNEFLVNGMNQFKIKIEEFYAWCMCGEIEMLLMMELDD